MSDLSQGLMWRDVSEWGVDGKGWAETEGHYDRLPAHARGRVSEAVWDLSKHSAGLFAQFETDAHEIYARWSLLSPRLAMPHMPATSVSGLDLYALDASGQWRWVAVGHPTATPENEVRLVYGIETGRRLYRLYFPLFNGVERIQLGIPSGANLQPKEPKRDRPIVVYGTSIVQGIAVSRAGMCYPAILGRRLGGSIINLGFAGRGKMEVEMAELLAEIDARLYVVDCVPNMEPPLLNERAEPFVKALRRLRPEAPIILVEDRNYGNAWIIPALRERNITGRTNLREIYNRLTGDGLSELYYVPGETLMDDDDEATVDGSHPSDLGAIRMAGHLEAALRRLVAT